MRAASSPANDAALSTSRRPWPSPGPAPARLMGIGVPCKSEGSAGSSSSRTRNRSPRRSRPSRARASTRPWPGPRACARDAAADTRPDLVLLDVMLPDGSGFDVARELRRTSKVPIIMLTAAARRPTVWPAWSWGRRLRREAVQRAGARGSRPGRSPASGGGRRAATGGRNRGRRGAPRSGQAIHHVPGRRARASRKEFDLRLLMENAGSVVTRERLIDEVWDTNWFGSTKTLDVHVSGLRKKLSDDCGPRYIHTVRRRLPLRRR